MSSIKLLRKLFCFLFLSLIEKRIIKKSFFFFSFLILGVFISSAQEEMKLKYPITPLGFYATVEFSKSGKLILFSEHQRTYLVDAVTFKTLIDFKNTVKSSFGSDGKSILIKYNDAFEIWDIESQKTVFSFPSSGYSDEAFITGDGKYIVMTVAKETWPVKYELIKIELTTNRTIYKTEVEGSYLALSTSPGADKVANYGFSNNAVLFDLVNGGLVII